MNLVIQRPALRRLAQKKAHLGGQALGFAGQRRDRQNRTVERKRALAQHQGTGRAL